MKRLFLIMITAVMLMAIGCSKDANNNDLSSNNFDPQTIIVGDKINGFTVKEVMLTDDGIEKVVFSGNFKMTGILSGNIVDGGGPNAYVVTFDKEEVINNLPIATTWELDKQDSDYKVAFYLHSEESVTKAIGEVRAEKIIKSIEDPWSGITEYKIEALLSEYTYLKDPLTGELSSLQLAGIQSIEDFTDNTNNNEDRSVINTTVTIWAYYDDPASFGSNAIVLEGLSKGEFIEIVVEGEIVNFEHVGLVFNSNTGMLEETDTINRIDKVAYQTIVIKTILPDGIPSEKIKWQSVSGNNFEWVIQEDGVGRHGWEYNLDEGSTIENQSFKVDFENWGQVKFVSSEKVLDGISKIHFHLEDEDGRIIYTFPEYHGNESWCFTTLLAVAFRDVNKDGFKDVVIIAEYMTGVGPQGTIPFLVSGIYFQNYQEFVSVPELNDEINSLGKNRSIDDVVKFAANKEIKLGIFDSGRFIKLIGSNQVEIRISAVPEDIPPRVFLLSEEVVISFTALGLKEGDVIRFTYLTNNQNEDVITDIVKITH